MFSFELICFRLMIIVHVVWVLFDILGVYLKWSVLYGVFNLAFLQIILVAQVNKLKK